MNGPIGQDKLATFTSSNFTNAKPELNIEHQLETFWKLDDGNCSETLDLSNSDRKALSV